MAEKRKDIPTPQQALLKAANYCAYQERCHKEVKDKLSEWGIYGMDADHIVLELIQQNYLNEERFARSFAGGKFRTKQWGRVKIRMELKAKQVSEFCIRAGMEEIDETIYTETIKGLAEEKIKITKDKNPLVRNHKAAEFLIRKGFEADLVWEVLRNLNHSG